MLGRLRNLCLFSFPGMRIYATAYIQKTRTLLSLVPLIEAFALPYRKKQATRSPRRYVHTAHTCVSKPDTNRSAHKCMQRDDTHPEDIQRCNAPNPINESCEVSISSKQSVIRRLYKYVRKTHPWRRHPVAGYAVRTTLRGLCNCKDTSKILNTQTAHALFEPRRAIICENGIFCVPLQAKRD